MADLAVIALGLDATGMKTGADQATRALTGVEKEMDAAQKKLTELEKRLQTSGATATTTGKQFQGLGDSVSKGAGALAGLGGPVGQAASSFQNLQAQVAGLSESFGLVGGAAVAALAGVAALGAALVKLTLDGVKLSDQMSDIAEATGLSIDQVQKLAAAFKLSGEDVSGLERSFRTFQNALQEATSDPASKAAENFRLLGIDAKESGRNAADAFIDALRHLKEYRDTTAGAAATNELLGRGIGALVRSGDKVNEVFGQTTEALVRQNKIAGQDGVEAAAKLDTGINQLSNSWDVFKQNLAGGPIGSLIQTSLDDINKRLSTSKGLLDLVLPDFRELARIALQGGRSRMAEAAAQGPTHPQLQGLFDAFQERSGIKPLDAPPAQDLIRRIRGGGGGGAAAARIDPAIAAQERDNAAARKKSADDLIKDMEDLSTAARETTRQFLDLVNPIDTTVDILNRAGLRTLAGAAAPPITAGAIPGVNIPAPLSPDQILGPRQQRIEDALGGIFEDFVFQITTARSTVGDAFKGLLLGITDTFAQEFAKAMQESLRDAFIKPIAGWLEDALSSIFEGISGKGIGKFLKTIGSAFVGAFAEGGTIPSGRWGIVGERGPEIAYAGSTPMQIAPMGGGGGGHITMNFAISTPTGEVSQRTQDQLADSAARGLERASRIRGAR